MNQKTTHKIWVGWFICSLGIAFYCYEYLLRIEPSVMVPDLMRYYDISAAAFGTLAAFYYFAYTPMQAVVGIVTDRYGARNVLVFALIACTLGSIVFASTHNLYVAAMARFLIGFGSSFAFVGALKLAVIWLPEKHFAFFTGITTGFAMVGAMAGNVEMTVLAHALGWKEVILYSSLIGMVLIPLVWFFVHDKPTFKQPQTDEPQVEIKDTIVSLWNAMKLPQMWITGFVGSMLFLSLSSFAELWSNDFLHTTFHMTAETAAISTSMIYLGWLIGSPLAGLLSDRIGSRKYPLIIGCFSACICFSVLLYLPGLSLLHIRVLLFLYGLLCSNQIVVFAVGRELSQPNTEAVYIAFINLLIMLGGMVFQPLIGKLVDLVWDQTMKKGIPIYTPRDFKIAMCIIPIGLLVAGILALRLKETFNLSPVVKP